MKNYLFLLFIFSSFTLHSLSQDNEGNSQKLNELYLDGVIARKDGKDFLFYIKGSAYSFIPGEKPSILFKFEGFNIRRRVNADKPSDFFLASREILFYIDPTTDQILDYWTNPWTKQKLEVFHIQNDPVNSRFRLIKDRVYSVSMDGSRVYGEISKPEILGDFYVWHNDIFPFYPLKGFDKNYTAAELFDFYIPIDEHKNKSSFKNVLVSWTRVGPWLPWMKMEGRDGLIVYHARSQRLESFEQLPTRIKELVRTKYPKYTTAPKEVDPAKP
ncbi:MAG TPA: DUF1838 family protein, partial [Candidatus Nitrosotenuis sp.]|nr:DUF1838 family protein [Candidatus Nitrosotenuis sp.]